jgi:hypothetical protein
MSVEQRNKDFINVLEEEEPKRLDFESERDFLSKWFSELPYSNTF